MSNFEDLSANLMLPLVSVILPCYNTERHIAEALRSIMQQDYKNLEIIVLDDHSSDGSWEIIQNLAAQDSRIRAVRNERNLQLIQTLNKGIQLARGQYIARMDADDISEPSRISTQIAYLKQHEEVDMVATCASYISETGFVLGRLNFHGCYNALSAAFVSMFDCPFLHPSIVIKGDLLRASGYPDQPEMHHIEDYALWIQLIQARHRLEIIPEKLMRYRISYRGVSQSNSKEQFSRGLAVATQYILNSLGLQADVRLLSILRQGADKINSLDDLSAADNYLKELADRFIEKYNPQDKCARSIRTWCSERILRILWVSVTRSKLSKAEKLRVIFRRLPSYFFKGFHSERLKNIYFHFQFMAKRRIFK
uniref:Glycosyl transferase family 2 n=1 Tax=Sphingobacterium sp. (strain 21) TaxID=743722 RepID=F4C876_SPHS2